MAATRTRAGSAAGRADDEQAVAEALAVTDTAELADRSVDELSGGQRQRVWIAMALAQQTDLLLLDEPTTFLDVAHQVEVLDLLTDLNHARGTTVVLVLHELNLAARYADHLVAMRAGQVVAAGPPGQVVTEQLVRDVFGLDCRVVPDPVAGTPMVVPIGRRRSSAATTRQPLPDRSPAMTVTAAPPAMLAFDVEVVGVRRLGPSMVRVTFGGDCLSPLR